MANETGIKIDLRPEVHADDSIDMDDALRTLAFHVNGFERNVAIFGLDLAWANLHEAAGELWVEGLR